MNKNLNFQIDKLNNSPLKTPKNFHPTLRQQIEPRNPPFGIVFSIVQINPI